MNSESMMNNGRKGRPAWNGPFVCAMEKGTGFAFTSFAARLAHRRRGL
ncbi:MAG: hypothetical protein LBL31_06930 [Spirochaetaceae bacterium]|nr:hypothetical protein [Spirochaetaceae bacterium]